MPPVTFNDMASLIRRGRESFSPNERQESNVVPDTYELADRFNASVSVVDNNDSNSFTTATPQLSKFLFIFLYFQS